MKKTPGRPEYSIKFNNPTYNEMRDAKEETRNSKRFLHPVLHPVVKFVVMFQGSLIKVVNKSNQQQNRRNRKLKKPKRENNIKIHTTMDDDLMKAFFSFEEPEKPFVSAQPSLKIEFKTEAKVEIDPKRENKGMEYSRRYRVKEEQLLATQTLNQPPTSSSYKSEQGLEETDNDDEDPVEIKNEASEIPQLSVFQHYDFNLNPQKLPILTKREDILAKIDSSYVVILTANTGTGKTSQVPQYILEQAGVRKEECNIIITQPRRIAGECHE